MRTGKSRSPLTALVCCFRGNWKRQTSATGEPDDVMSTFEAGADGYLREAMTFETLIRAIELPVQDEAIVPPEFVRSLRWGFQPSARSGNQWHH